MASPDQAFSELERASLLKEIIISTFTQTTPPSHVLAQVVRELQIQPQWDDIRLPQGRTVGQCKTVFNEMMGGAGMSRQPPPPLQTSLRAQQTMQPPIIAPQPEYPYSAQRAIQPKPPHFQPQRRLPSDSPSSPFSPTSSEPLGRKRGRPNREESERRQRAREDAMARGEKDPFPSRSRKKPRPESSSTATGITTASPSSTTLAPLGISTTSSIGSAPSTLPFTTTSEAFAPPHPVSGTYLPPIYTATPSLSLSSAGRGAGPRYETPTSGIRERYDRPPPPQQQQQQPPPQPLRQQQPPPAGQRLSRQYSSEQPSYQAPQVTQPPPPRPMPPSTSAPPLQTQEPRLEGSGSRQQGQGSPSSAEPMEQ